jgi:hypothetical protein
MLVYFLRHNTNLTNVQNLNENGTVIHYAVFHMAAVKTTCCEIISVEEK